MTLVVVSKTVSEDRVREALAAGARDLGENRAQELIAKAAALRDTALAGNAPPPRWHFVGRLQRNKVKSISGTRSTVPSSPIRSPGMHPERGCSSR